MPKLARGFALLLLLVTVPAPAECLMTVLSCNATIDRAITNDDCLDSDQSHYDLYRIHGLLGQFIELTVAPLDGSLTMPYLKLITPTGDSAGTPFIGGGGTPRLRFILTASGEWTLMVGTMQAPEIGPYRLALRCNESASVIPPEEWYCVAQKFSCGQVAHWKLDASSCDFSDGGVYAEYVLDFTPGAELHFRLHSDDFDPRLGIYYIGGHPLTRGIGARYLVDAQLTHTPTQPPGDYHLDVSALNDQNFGEFTLYGDCAAPPVCIPPLITVPPRSVTIAPGDSIRLDVTVSGSGPFTYTWHDSQSPAAIGSSPTLTVAKLARTTSYSVEVTNACGDTTSAAAVITVKRPRERSAQH